ncbi:MAG: hypothetical protein RLZZ595_173 [Bacteroidota bacterium]
MENDTQISCFPHGQNSAQMQLYGMRRWICVAGMIPFLCAGQPKSGQDAIPIGWNVYQKPLTPILTASDLPAILGFRLEKQLGVMIENKYGLKELSNIQLGLGIPTGSGSFLFRGNFRGGKIQQLYAGSIAYGLTINPNTAIGISVGGEVFQLKGYTPETTIQAIAGIMHAVNEKTTIGIHYNNRQSIYKTNNINKSKTNGLSFGIGYQLSKPVFLQLELSKQEQTRIITSICWSPLKQIGFFAGTNSSGNFYVGGQTKNKNTTSSIGVASHPQLGYSLLLHFNLVLRNAD